MIAVLSGDIIASRKLVNQEKWLLPLKHLFSSWGESPRDWKVDRGDFFQIEITNLTNVLQKALQIKALIKSVEPIDEHKITSTIDVRIAIGLGEKTFLGESISESNGPAFINSGEKLDQLKKENATLGIKTAFPEFDEEINLYLKLSCLFMDKWSVPSAQLVQIVLQNPGLTQEEIGKQLGIKQNSVSGRWNRSNVNEMMEVEHIFRKKIKTLIDDLPH